MVYIHSKIKFRPLNSIHRFRFAFKFPFITSIYTSYEWRETIQVVASRPRPGWIEKNRGGGR